MSEERNDFLIADLSVHLFARKSLAYKRNVLTWFETLLRFLDARGLATRRLLRPDESLAETYELRRSDLTERGFAVFKAGFHRWLHAVDTGKAAPTDDGLLVRALEKEMKRDG